ncbi:MAG: peroxiredoxin [Deltaproteobacteria bacterium]|nr:peroxiredoxin [Deltaproteobacteria bacterium]
MTRTAGSNPLRYVLLVTTLLALAALALAGCGSRAGEPASEGAASLSVGDPAPAFSLADQDGRVRTLAEYQGRPVVLYFYPRDATPGCTTEACAFRDAWDRLQATGAVVLGVSTDDEASHRNFRNEHGLPFDLLSDPESVAADAYHVPVRLGTFAARHTFLIDRDGRVAHIWRDVDPGVHANEVITAIAALPSE